MLVGRGANERGTSIRRRPLIVLAQTRKPVEALIRSISVDGHRTMSQSSRSLAQRAFGFLRGLALSLLLSSPIALQSAPVKAGDAETASVAVDIFVKGGQAAGLPISDREAAIVKEIVTCGLAGTSVGDCVRNAAMATVLKQLGANQDMANAANCLAAGTRAATCLSNAVVAQLPVEAQPLATCMISGQGNVADCTKKFAEGQIIGKVPQDFQPVARCMIETQDAKKCGTEFVVQQIASKLPPNVRSQAKEIAACIGNAQQAASCVASAAVPDEIKPLVGCATQQGANIGKCMADFASQNLPAGTPGVAKDLVGCVGAPDFAKCAEQKAISSAKDFGASQLSQAEKDAIQAALSTIDKLRPDAPMTIDAGVKSGNMATLQNILKVANGIKNGNWGEVVIGAGPELAIIASNIILSIFLTPAMAAALGPAVEAMIHNDVAAAMLALDAISKGDAVKLAQVIFEWYETSFIDKPCALIGDGAVKDTICGGLSDAIKFISDSGADLAKEILGAGQDVLEWLGVWSLVDDVATTTWNTLKDAVVAVGNFFGLGDEEEKFKPAADCGLLSPKAYFANNYLACMSKATDASSGSGVVDTGQLDAACVAKFNTCVAPKGRPAVAQACAAMGDSLRSLAKQLGDGMRSAADAYTDFGGPAKLADDVAKNQNFGDADDMCAPNFWQQWRQVYATRCAAFVSGPFPLPKPASMGGPVCAQMVTQTSAARKVCLDSFDKNAGKEALVGPNSEYCRKQKEAEGSNPCTVGTKGPPILLPDGRKIDNITVKCPETVSRPPFAGGTIEAERLKSPEAERVRSSAPFLGTGGKVTNSPGLTDKLRAAVPPGGTGGAYQIDGRTGNSPTTRPPKATAPVNRVIPPPKKQAPAPVQVVKRPSGTGGFNMTRPSAMDRLTGSNAISSVGGTHIGVDIGGRPRPCPTCAAKPAGTAKPAGAANPVVTARPAPAAPRPPVTSSRPKSAPDPRIDFGGCAGCGKKAIDVR